MGLIKESKKIDLIIKSKPWTNKELKEFREIMKSQTINTIAVNIYKESYDVYCGRSGKGQDGYFGNPFKGIDAILKFENYFYSRLDIDPEFKKRVQELKGKRLGCFCKPKPCHVDIICKYLND